MVPGAYTPAACLNSLLAPFGATRWPRGGLASRLEQLAGSLLPWWRPLRPCAHPAPAGV